MLTHASRKKAVFLPPAKHESLPLRRRRVNAVDLPECYRYARIMKVATRNNGFLRDLTSQEALDRFRKAAKAFTTRATKSREVARQVLVSEGIYTKSGRLAKNYR